MPIYEVDAPNGKTYRVEGPENARPEDIGRSFMVNLYPGILESEKPKPERGIGQLLTDAAKRGAAGIGVKLGDELPAYAARVAQRGLEGLGAETLAGMAGSYADRQLREAAQSELEIARKYPQEFKSFEDVSGPVSGARYAAEAFGESLPSLGYSVAGGAAIGAGLGAALGPAGAAAGAVAGGATGAVRSLLTSAAARTALGTYLTSGTLTVPEAYSTILRETGREELAASFVAGSVNAALDAVVPTSIANKLTGRTKQALYESISKRLGIGFAESAAMEGLTEGMQEAVNKAAVSFVDENKEFFTSENWKQVLDSALRGAIGGGPVGAIARGVSGSAAPQEAPPTAPGTEAPPPAAGPLSPTDTPEQRAVREDPETIALLTNLNYQPSEIGSLPFDVLQDIIANKIPAEEFFKKAQAQPKPKPAEEGPVTGTEAPLVAEGAPLSPTAEQPAAPETPTQVEMFPEMPPIPAAGAAPTEAPAQAPVAEQPSQQGELPFTETKPLYDLKPSELPTYDLPKGLAGAKTPFNYQGTKFDLSFANGIDKALYITSGAVKSKSDEKYRQFLRDKGFVDSEIDSFGKMLRNNIKIYLMDLTVQAGSKGGVIPIDFMRNIVPTGYASILETKGVTVKPTPAPLAAPWQTQYFGPLTEQGPSPETEFETFDLDGEMKPVPVPLSLVTSKTIPATMTNIGDQLNALIPGVVDVIRTIHANLYPGTKLEIRPSTDGNAFASYTPIFTLPGEKTLLRINVNMKAFEENFNGAKDKQQYLLKTLFHELSHPLQYTLLNAVDQATFDSVIQQYIKDRNPSALERALLKEALVEGRETITPEFRRQFMQKMGLFDESGKAAAAVADPWNLPAPSEEIIRKYMESTGRKADPTLSEELRKDYYRSFNEWIAESGAAWMTKELQNLVPKTTFEKFQKAVLDGLRNIYRAVTEALGIKPNEGAFEKLLREVYGKRMGTAPAKSYEATQRSQKDKPYKGQIITRNLVSGKFTDADLRSVGVEPTDVDRNVSEPPAPTGAAAQQPTKTYNDIRYVLAPNDKSMTGLVGRILRSLTGANPGESFSRALARNVVNSNIPFLEREDLRNLGKMIEGLMNSTGRVMGTVLISPMGYNRVNKTFYFHSGADDKSLKDIFASIGTKNAEQFQLVALAARELALRKDRKVYVKGKNGETILPEALGKLTNKDLQDIIDSADPAVKKALEEFQKFNDKMIEMSVQAGLIPRNLAERFKTLMYTPMYRVQEQALKDDPNIGLFSGILDALKDPQGVTAYKNKVGSLETGAINGNFYENILRNYNAIVSAAVRNVAYQETANVLTRIAQNGGDTTIAEVFDKPSQGTIQYRVNGEDRYLKIYDPSMFQAIAALSPQQKNMFVRAMSWFTDLLRKGVTATPPFQIRNLIRGLVELKIKTGMPVMEILRGTLAGAKDTWSKGDAYREILGQTGFGGFGFGSGSANQAAYLERLYKSRELSWTQWQKYPNAFMRLFDNLEAFGEITEMAPRIAYYNYLRRNGMSKNDATWEAVNLVNYHRHGSGNGILGNVVSNLIPLTPFLTARIQGLYRLVEKGTEGGKGAFGRTFEKEDVLGIPKAILSRGMMVLAINAMVNAMYGDDDWYKKLTVKDRLSNMYVKIGDTIVALPRAFEIGELFGGLPTLAFDSMRKQSGEEVTRGFLEFLSKTFLLDPAPQFAKPLAELYANKNFYTGLPIENLSDKRSPKEERFDEYTSSFAKMAGHVGKYVELSPKQIDTIIRGYLGTSATLFLGTLDALLGTAGTKPQGVFGDPNSVAGVAANLSGAASILKNESQLNNKFVGDFYEIKQRVTEIVQSMNDAARRGDVETIKARIEQMPQAKGLFTAFNSANERLSQINGQMDAIRTRSNLTAEQKTDMLEKLRKMKGQIAEQMVTVAERVGVTR